jgi:hypothetical protein
LAPYLKLFFQDGEQLGQLFAVVIQAVILHQKVRHDLSEDLVPKADSLDAIKEERIRMDMSLASCMGGIFLLGYRAD